MKPLLLLSALLFVSPLRAEPISALILDGTPVSSSSDISKSMVQLEIGGALCSGVVISPRHVLTAGHCVASGPAVSRMRVYLGAARRNGPAVAAYRLHSGYGKEGGYLRGDLAVLKLASTVPAGVVPAPVATPDLSGGETLVTAGYGYSDRARTTLGRLLKSDFKVGSSAFMDHRFSDGTRVLRIEGRFNLCQGDSGGATFRRTSAGLRTVGIHSMADCDRVGYDVFAPDHKEWVTRQLAM